MWLAWRLLDINAIVKYIHEPLLLKTVFESEKKKCGKRMMFAFTMDQSPCPQTPAP